MEAEAFLVLLDLHAVIKISLLINNHIAQIGNIFNCDIHKRGARLIILSAKGSIFDPHDEPPPAFLARKPSSQSVKAPIIRRHHARNILFCESKRIKGNPRNNLKMLRALADFL